MKNGKYMPTGVRLRGCAEVGDVVMWQSVHTTCAFRVVRRIEDGVAYVLEHIEGDLVGFRLGADLMAKEWVRGIHLTLFVSEN